jgi:hypothetical protein
MNISICHDHFHYVLYELGCLLPSVSIQWYVIDALSQEWINIAELTC